MAPLDTGRRPSAQSRAGPNRLGAGGDGRRSRAGWAPAEARPVVHRRLARSANRSARRVRGQQTQKRRERQRRSQARRTSVARPFLRIWQGHQDRRAELAAKTPSGERRALIAGLTLSVAGLCILMFFGYVFLFSGFQEARAQHQLLQLFEQHPPPADLFLGEHVGEGKPEAILTVPTIDLHELVVNGTSATDLTLGPGYMTGTAPIGTRGNAVIAGRRTTAGAPFRRLLTLRAGDRFTVVTGYGEFGYDVVRVGIAVPGSRSPISPSHRAELTLVTSNPAYLSTGMAYVTASLTTHPARGPALHGVPPRSVLGLSGDSAAIVPSVVWGLALVGCLIATVSSYRRWPDQLASVYLLTTPVVLAVALLWCENAFRLLPATL